MNKIDFMGRRGVAAIVSLVMVSISLITIATKGIEKNVDFEGGSKLNVVFKQSDLAIGDLRKEVGNYEPGAVIVSLKTEQERSEFSVKIKNPQSNERESDVSPERRQGMEQAFSMVSNEDNLNLSLLRSVSVDDLAARLLAEDIYGISDTDAVKQSTYAALAQKLKTGIEAATSIRALADSTDSEKGGLLARGLVQSYPAINRTTADQLSAILIKYNPLARASGVSYHDIADQIIAARTDKGDFFTDFTFLKDLTLGEGEDSATLTTFITSNFVLGNYRIVAIENFSASIAAELLNNAYKAVILALFGILIYLWLRFSLAFGISSVVALTHDVIISLGVFSLAGMELSNPVVAAFLTIVGYSLNDTIVVFDRIRGNLRQARSADLAQTMNDSISQTLSRTIVTSLTTLFVVAVIYFFSGNEVLETFSFPLLIGVVVGTYSSIFVASPSLLLWHTRFKSILT